MVNNIKDAISIRLNQVFGDTYEIYTIGVEQGLEEPCFFIKTLSPTRKQIIGNRYFLEVPIDIHYFPSVKNDNDELDEVGTSLFNDLEYITMVNGDQVRGTKMSYEKFEGVLHFFVSYGMFLIKTEELDPMGEISYTGGVKTE
jgi:hypothetical protein